MDLDRDRQFELDRRRLRLQLAVQRARRNLARLSGGVDAYFGVAVSPVGDECERLEAELDGMTARLGRLAR